MTRNGPPPTPVPTLPVNVLDTARAPIDWLFDVAGGIAGIAGVVALFYGIAAYRAAQRESAEARRMLARERRITFELDVLRDLIAIVEAHPDSVDFPHFTRLSDFQPEELPFWRFLADVHGSGS